MTQMTREEMDEVLLAHEIAELEYNLEATLATLVPDPHFELCFMGLQVDGIDAVREMYSRLLYKGARDRDVMADARVIAEGPNALVREAWVTLTNDEGERVTGLYMVTVEFDPVLKKIKGERMYGDPAYAAEMVKVVGADLADYPGVSKLSDHAPILDKHDAFAAAAARGIHIDNHHNV